MRECNRRKLVDLRRICVFEEEDILSMMPGRSIRLTRKCKGGQMRKFASLENPAAQELIYMGTYRPRQRNLTRTNRISPPFLRLIKLLNCMYEETSSPYFTSDALRLPSKAGGENRTAKPGAGENIRRVHHGRRL